MTFFKLFKRDGQTKARRGRLETQHGTIETPFFMPVGTNGTVKTLTHDDLHAVNAQILLSNTYHLYLRPGMDLIRSAGGLHEFIGWHKPMLTDSGGYQVFSLSKLRKIKPEGVEFRSHLDGSLHMFTPESVVDTEYDFGVDMMMPLDVCAPYPCDRQTALESVDMTLEWAKRSWDHFHKKPKRQERRQALFGIVQGATYEDLRIQHAMDMTQLDFDGFAIGGVSVGEPVDEMFKALRWVEPNLPADKPRYFMGIGLPDQIVKAVGEGVDMFDTVLPSRMGRHATALTSRGRKLVRNAEFKDDAGPLDEQCSCHVCRNYSLRYIRHLANQNEITALRLIVYHNIHFYITLMARIRDAIDQDVFPEFQENFFKSYGSDIGTI
jgi:queuine tRNA-ribosyltransferase